MRSKKQIKLDRVAKQQKAKRKQIRNLILGVLIFCFAVFQAVLVLINVFSPEDPGHHQIIISGKTMTTEVCTQWFSYSGEYQKELEDFIYVDGFKEIPVPKDIVIEVCSKWKIIKEEIDSNLNLCVEYSKLTNVSGIIIKGVTYYELNGEMESIIDIVEDCKEDGEK